MDEKQVTIGRFTSFMGVHYQYISDSNGRVYMSLTGSDKDQLVVFHHDARADWGSEEHKLVLNTKTAGAWGTEVRPSGFPFTPNVNVAVTATFGPPNIVKTYANSKEITTYNIPAGANISDIKGVSIISENNAIHPTVKLGIIAFGIGLVGKDPMKYGSSVIMAALAPTDLSPGVFNIRLLKEQLQYYPTSDVLLNINPRKDTIVFNTKSGGSWTRDETIANNYFTPGAAFLIAIITQNGYFEIRVNGEFAYGFKFRSSDHPLYATIEGVPTLTRMAYEHSP
uniref:Galectin n=1 Tax=Halichondria okadai TaxID=163232 RepID=A0AB74UHC1_HALOK